MANNDNLIPLNKRKKAEARKIQRKGAYAANAVKRKKSSLKKIMETVLAMDIPSSEIESQLRRFGVDTTMEYGLVLSVILQAIKTGNHNALKTIQAILEQDQSRSDKAEQKAKTALNKARLEKLKLDLALNDRAGERQAQAQANAIADMLNEPAQERVISDFLTDENEKQEKDHSKTIKEP